MPKNYKDRDRKHKKKKGMVVNSRGLITVIMPLKVKKGKKAKEQLNDLR